MPNHKLYDWIPRNFEKILFFYLLVGLFGSQNVHASDNGATNSSECHNTEHTSIQLASFRWEEIGVYFTITAFVVIAGFAKLGFHKLSWLSSKVPESCLLILLGLALSTLIYFTSPDEDEVIDPCDVRVEFPQFTSQTFFLILLPPIILESAYSLHDRVFLDNIGTVLIFAVIGTIINAFAIGGSLYGVSAGGLVPGMNVTLTDALTFSSLISAVDPVAVLAIFQELGVNQNLYFLIFGESLLNDGVTVVLYNTMQVFQRMVDIEPIQYFLAVVSFFTVCFGGVLIGIIYGLLTALATKWTTSVRVVEPLALLGLAYLSYLTAELFHFSGIICLIVCGLIQAHYGFYNISQKSYICVKYFTKMASATSDTVIFMFLGIVLVNDSHEWNGEFVLWSLLFCLVYRFIVTFSLSAVANIYRTKPIDLEEQFIAAYGGLRGAVAFSLATTLHDDMPERNTYIFTTLVVILFTVFIQGITIKPLVNLLKIKKKRSGKTGLMEEISNTSIDHAMAGIEEVLGHHGDFYLRELIMRYNDKYLKKWLLHEECDSKLTRLFEKIALSEHYAHLYGPVAMIEDQMKPLIEYPSKENVGTPPISPLIQQDEILFRASMRRRFSTDAGREPQRFGSTKTNRRSSRRRSIKNFFPNVSVKPSSSGAEEPEENESSVLRKALRNNRYNKLHYTYNRNLVDEEDQEMENHLHRRSFNAHRMSALASATYDSRHSLDELENGLPGQMPLSRENSVLDHEPELFTKSMVLVERHKRRSMRQRERAKSMTSPEPPIVEESRENSKSPDSANSRQIENGSEDQPKEQQEEFPLLDIVTYDSNSITRVDN